jgi:general secretion pathway protein K
MRATEPERNDGDRGAALVVVLWICMVVALLAGAFTLSLTLEARRLSAQQRSAEARALLEAGLAHAVMGILHPDPSRRRPADGSAHAVREGDARLTLRVWDEAGRIDLNRAPPEAVMAVLGMAGADGEALGAELLRRREGQEPLRSLSELAGLGLDAQGYRRLAPLVTVHNPIDGGGLAVSVAPAGALRAWPGVSTLDVAAAMRARERAAAGFSTDAAARLTGLGLSLDPAQGPVYTVRMEVETPAGARASAEAVMLLSVDGFRPYRILEWREPAPDLDLDASLDNGS